MPADRFAFQKQCIRKALDELDGPILNVGCCDDQAEWPSNSLKPIDPERVINCDISAVDEQYDESGPEPVVIRTRPTAAEVLFDCARDHWPFTDGTAALVILGDILEHLEPDDIRSALTEARRVSQRLCITVPEDHRATNTPERADKYRRGHVHRTIVTEQLLRRILRETGWKVRSWQFVEYDDGTFWGQRTLGHFVEAQ